MAFVKLSNHVILLNFITETEQVLNIQLPVQKLIRISSRNFSDAVALIAERLENRKTVRFISNNRILSTSQQRKLSENNLSGCAMKISHSISRFCKIFKSPILRYWLKKRKRSGKIGF